MKIEVIQNVNGCWYWRLVAENGEILATSEAYSSKSKCMQTVKSVNKTTGLAIC